jgi:hypothetical protein
MRPIDRSEILPIGEYELIRPRFRARVIEEKRPRRVRLGEHVSAIFENRDTALLQIQEMLRTERITSENAIAHEIETYNDLIPAEGELSMTLFVEIPEAELRNRMLIDLQGLENHVAIEVDGALFPAKSDPKGVMPDRTTAVHYFKVKLSDEARAAVRGKNAKVAVRVDHPRYTERAELGPASIEKLAEDLS